MLILTYWAPYKMKRKRINHQVDTFCEMFSGWRLVNDMEMLVQLKQGYIDLDLIDKLALLNGEPLDKDFHILHEISDWFIKDLINNNIDKNFIRNAGLKVVFASATTEGKPKSKTNRIIEIKLSIEATILTDEKEYRAAKDKTIEYHYIKN